MQNTLKSIGITVVVLGILGVVCFAAYLGYTDKIALTAKREQIEREIAIFPQPPKSQMVGYHTVAKSGANGCVSKYYKSGLTFDEIKKVYDPELRKNGWVFQRESTIPYEKGAHNLRVLEYRKGEFKATLDFPEPGNDFGWDFCFGMSWGL